jgi:hypothetical protein
MTTKKKSRRRGERARGAGRKLANSQETYNSPSIELRYNKISPSFAACEIVSELQFSNP